MQLNFINREKIFSIFLLFIFFLLSLFDLYFIKYGRVFDVMGISLFFFYVLLCKKFPKGISNNEFIILLSLLILLLLLPPTFKNYLTHGVILFGFICFIAIRRLNTNIIRLNLFRLIIILITFQLIDYISYYYFNTELFNFSDNIIKHQLRGYGTDYFRPSGLFRESNSFASLLTLLYFSQCRDSLPSLKLSSLVIFSLILSNSMFALGTATIISIFYLFNSRIYFFIKIFFIAFYIIVFLYFSTDTIFYRFENFSDEVSLRARLNLFNYDNFNLIKLFIPSGFNSIDSEGISDKDQLFGLNGFSFVFDGIGLFAFFFYFLVLKRLNLFSGVLFLLLNITYHIYLNFFFYFVIAIYFQKKKKN
jgi:hypothetical protein